MSHRNRAKSIFAFLRHSHAANPLWSPYGNRKISIREKGARDRLGRTDA